MSLKNTYPRTICGQAFIDLCNEKPWMIVPNDIVSSSPYTILSTDEILFADTDSSSVILYLPKGVNGAHYNIKNVGSSLNDANIYPYGSEEIFGDGAGVKFDLKDDEVIDIHFNSAKEWR